MAYSARIFPARGGAVCALLTTAAMGLLFSALVQCQFDPSPAREERYLTVQLNDSLKRFDSVEIVILLSGDTSKAIGKMWSGPLPDPAAVPSFRLDDGEDRALAIRVRGFDSTGTLTHNMLITRNGGLQTVADLPIPKPKAPVGTGPVPLDSVMRAWSGKRVVDIKINRTGLPPRTLLRNCPMLIRLDKENFDFTQAAPDGKDFRFTRADGKPLAHEVARWETANAGVEADIWVRLDSIRSDDDSALIILWFGNPSAADTSNAPHVFGEADGFSGVWHLNELGNGQAGEFRDAGGRYHGTGGTGDGKQLTARLPGVVGYGQEFNPGGLVGSILTENGQGAITLPKNFDPGNHAWTFQAWIRRSGLTDGVIFFKANGYMAGEQRFQILCTGGGVNQVVIQREGAEYATNVYLPTNLFTFVALTYNGARVEIYVNGILRESKAFSQGGDPSGPPSFGNNQPLFSGQGFTGNLDETWFSDQVRSPEWLLFQYETQRPQSQIVIVRPP